jgi:hypothetical protein
MVHAISMLHRAKDRRAALSNLARIALHNAQISTHSLCQINLVNNQQVTARNTWSAFARHFVSASDVNYVDNVVSELARVVGSEIVTAGLDEEEICAEFAL